MPRKLPSFIDAFMQYTSNKGAPSIYCKWAGIFTVGAAMERKVWLRTAKGKLYPNQYIVATGPAGIGKSLVTNLANDFLRSVNTPETPFFIAPVSVTKASLIDRLDEAKRRIVRPMDNPPVISFNSLTVIPNELAVFLPSYDSEFMSTLTDLWDCKHYSETRRTSKLNINIPSVQLNLFTATTPAQLTNFLPEGAWEQGFMSRVILIYSGESLYTDLFYEQEFEEQLHKDLTNDIRHIYSQWGERTVTEDAKEAIRAWAKAGGTPIPDHPKLVGYTNRRAAHLLKLCLIASASSSDEPFITLEHFTEALDWLVEAESFMPDIFKSMKVGADARAVEELYHFAITTYMKEKKPVLEHRLVFFLQERVPAHSVGRILENMERAKVLKKEFVGTNIGYVPQGKRAA